MLATASAASLLALVSFAAGSAAAPPAKAGSPTSSFYYESELGNDFGQGTSDYITSADADFMALRGNMGNPSVGIDVTGWMVGAAGPGGAKLVAGTTYTGARNAPHATAPWLDLSSQRLYGNCYDLNGDFTVHDVGYFGAQFSRLSLSFTATCESSSHVVAGELRFNTSAPAFDGVTVSPVNRRYVEVGYAPVGGTGDKTTVALTNVGSGAVSVGAASMTGANPGDFRVVDDTCAGIATLGVGASCTFGVRLAPTTLGQLDGIASIAVGTIVATRQMTFRGTGQRPTTTTIEGPTTGWHWPPIDLSARVSPSPTSTDGGSSIWFWYPDADSASGPWSGPTPMMADGTAQGDSYPPPGVHRVYAEFNRNGTGTWAPSRSETITFKIMQASGIALTSSQNPTNSDEPPVITARLTPAGVTFDGGQLILKDMTTDQVLASLDVKPGQKKIRIEPFLTAGDHLLRAEYDGYVGVQGSSSELTQTIRANAGATVFPRKIFPVVDGYLDTLEVEAWRYHPLKVDIVVRSLAADTVVRSHSFPPETEDILWRWNGRNDSGALVAAGKYELQVIFSDGGTGPKVVKNTITVSRDWVKWRTKRVVLSGRAYSLSAKSRNASISKAGSGYARGVKLNSGKGLATVSYAFPVVKADVYGRITFAVQGRSTNRHKGLVAVWNPHAGGFRYVDNYDVAKLIGPGYKWWKTSVPSNDDRVRKGKVRALVMVAKGMGKSGPAVFDVRKVKLTYQAGTLIRATAASPAGATPDDRILPLGSTGIVGRSATDILGTRSPVLRARAHPPVLPQPQEPAATEESRPTNEPLPPEEPAATEAPTPFPTQEPTPTPGPAPTVAPTTDATSESSSAPTKAPEPTPEPVPNVEPTPGLDAAVEAG